MANPLELEEKDDVQARVTYALRKAVGGEARFFPEIWYVVPGLTFVTFRRKTHH